MTPKFLLKSADFSHRSQLVRYANQRFDLWLLAGRFSDGRSEPRIPARSVWLSLVLGEVIGQSALSQIGRETQLPQWQRWVGDRGCISHDTLGYAAKRYDPAHLRRGLGWINRKLIAFTLFHAFAILHGKSFRLGLATLKELRKRIYRSLLCSQPILLCSG